MVLYHTLGRRFRMAGGRGYLVESGAGLPEANASKR